MANNSSIQSLSEAAISLLKQLIAAPSLSRSEDQTATILESFLADRKIPCKRIQNNVYAVNKNYDPHIPTLLLNSHHDTVAPNKNYTNDPFKPVILDGKLYGLGSNDAGGPLVSLLSAFLFFYESKLPFNIIFAASAEEEVSGKDGIELLLQHLPKVDMAIVGEPTQMRMAIAEKGLLVVDGVARGKAGHAARDEGENAIQKFVEDFEWLKNYSFEKVSDMLGTVHTALTVVETKNKQHNVVPDECTFVIDIRVNELYSLEEVMTILQQGMQSELKARSMRLKPSFIGDDHPLVISGIALGMECFGSPTMSDMALMNFPAVKCGPGDSARSHTADEFIFADEINSGVQKYIKWIQSLQNVLNQSA